MFNQSPIIGHSDGFQLFTVIHGVVIKFLVYIFLNELFIHKRGGALEWVMGHRGGQGREHSPCWERTRGPGSQQGHPRPTSSLGLEQSCLTSSLYTVKRVRGSPANLGRMEIPVQ